MRSEIISRCRRYARNGYAAGWIAERVGLSLHQVLYALDDSDKQGGQKEKDGSPDELIDGERLADRISRMTKEIKGGRLIIQRAGR